MLQLQDVEREGKAAHRVRRGSWRRSGWRRVEAGVEEACKSACSRWRRVLAGVVQVGAGGEEPGARFFFGLQAGDVTRVQPWTAFVRCIISSEAYCSLGTNTR